MLQSFKMIWAYFENGSGYGIWNLTLLNDRTCTSLGLDNSTYTMHGQVLDSVESARYLGVDIASDLNFSHLKRNIKTKHSGIRDAAYKTIVPVLVRIC